VAERNISLQDATEQTAPTELHLTGKELVLDWLMFNQTISMELVNM
jgi:hypothetical protein